MRLANTCYPAVKTFFSSTGEATRPDVAGVPKTWRRDVRLIWAKVLERSGQRLQLANTVSGRLDHYPLAVRAKRRWEFGAASRENQVR